MKLALKNNYFVNKYLVLDVNTKNPTEVLTHLKAKLSREKVNVSTLMNALLDGNKFTVNNVSVGTTYDVRVDLPYGWDYKDVIFHDFAGGKTSTKLMDFQGECCKPGDIVKFQYNGGSGHNYRLVKVKSIDSQYITGDDLEKGEFRKYSRSSVVGKVEVIKNA